jgi:hypothetical protein
MAMRPNLNRPIAGVGHGQLERLSSSERLDISLSKNDFAGDDMHGRE